MMQSTILHNLTPEQIGSMFEELKKDISSLKLQMSTPKSDKFLTRQEVATELKCDLSTVHNWTKAGILISYAIGNRVYYKQSDIEAAMIPSSKKKNSN
jgi:hypothetical protein